MTKGGLCNTCFAKLLLITFFALVSVPFCSFAQTSEKYVFKGTWQLRLYEKTVLKKSVNLTFDRAGTGFDSNQKPFIWGWHEDQLIIRTLSEDWILSIVPIDAATFNVQAEISQIFDESAVSEARKQLGLKSSVSFSGFMKKGIDK